MHIRNTWDITYYDELFIEVPYYTAEYLNLWMREDSDEIIDQIFEDITKAEECFQF